jgi:electron transport complex protein RnfB
MVAALLVTAAFAASLGAILLWLRPRQPGDAELVEQINDLLPQTQCRRCTFDGCRPYAAAIARGEAGTNQCPPGGEATAVALANLLRREPRKVDPQFGVMPARPAVAVIDEATCIGCTKCIQACPVDAIVGGSKFMHTVIAADCTGCELCIPPCPVDCIDMRPAPAGMQRLSPLVAAAG